MSDDKPAGKVFDVPPGFPWAGETDEQREQRLEAAREMGRKDREQKDEMVLRVLRN